MGFREESPQVVHAFPHPKPFWRPWEEAGVQVLESRCPELSGVLGCLGAIVFYPCFFFSPSLCKMLTGFYFVFFPPVNSPDGVGYVGKKRGSLWEEEHI